MTALAVAAAVVLAVLHLFAGRLRFLGGVPRSRWLSIAGGISVAYVLVHLLPELAEYQDAINERSTAVAAALERHVYVLALLGLSVFYGLERWTLAAKGTRTSTDAKSPATIFSFVSYGVYNAMIGYLLVRREGGVLLFAIAMGLHFAVNDHALREHHGEAYHRYGRWLLSAAVVTGAVVGTAVEFDEPVIGILLAFIGGGTILNVLKEELPAQRESRFGAFLAGATVYTAVLLAI